MGEAATAMKRILFVDDEPNIIDGLRRMLRRQRDEWEMVFCGSGDEALALMGTAPFDIIVTDMQMPEMGGADLLERVVEHHPQVARIVLSGHADEAVTRRAAKLAHQFLSKPTDAETLRAAVARACATQQTVGNERIKALVAACDRLPSLPGTYLEITRIAESDTGDARKIAAVISRDMALSAKLLQLVNSSFFGIGRRISSIDQSVTLLGQQRVKGLVLSEGVFSQLRPTHPKDRALAEAVWNDASPIGELSRQISASELQGEDRLDQAFTAGLLHDVGMLLMISQRSEEYRAIIEDAEAKQEPIEEVERRTLGATHAEIGAYLLGLWGLPPRIVEAVMLHHRPAELPYSGLCAVTVVHAADALVQAARSAATGKPATFWSTTLDEGYLAGLGMDDKLPRWRSFAEALVNDDRKACK